MTWTYDETVRTDLNRVREKIGDTDESNQLLADEVLDEFLDGSTVLDASIEAVERIIAKLARQVSRNAIGISTERDQVTQHYRDLLAQLKAERGGFATVYAGGLSIAEKDSIESNTDFELPRFSMGRDRNT